jgi:hypothetical protein
MSNNEEHRVLFRWMAGRTSIKSINYPIPVPTGQAWGIPVPYIVHSSAVPLISSTKDRQQPVGRICKGQEIYGLQEATSKYWSFQQDTASIIMHIHSLVHVLMK